jgi:hypothetical protein
LVQLSKQFDASLQKELMEVTGLEQGTGETPTAFARRVLADMAEMTEEEWVKLSKRAQLWYNFCDLMSDKKLTWVPGSSEPLPRVVSKPVVAPPPWAPKAPDVSAPPVEAPEGVPYQRVWIKNITEKLYGTGGGAKTGRMSGTSNIEVRPKASSPSEKGTKASNGVRAKRVWAAAHEVFDGLISNRSACDKYGITPPEVSQAVTILRYAPELEARAGFKPAYEEAIRRKREKADA